MEKFSRQTFSYFDDAQKNDTKAIWLEKNKERYLEYVRNPMTVLVTRLQKSIAPSLPRIDVHPRKITRPSRRPKDRHDTRVIKTHTHLTLMEKPTSRFEWNPGIYLQIGAKTDDNYLGVGLYMTSSRQLSRMRAAWVDDFETIDKILRSKKLSRHWGKVQGELYKRFPKGFQEDHPAAKYLWFKQFYLGKNFSRSEVISKDFFDRVDSDLKASLEFLEWVRQTVGVYTGPTTSKRLLADERD